MYFGSQASGKVLVVEPEHLITQLLSDSGHQVMRLRYHECLKSPGKDVIKQLRDHEIVGICVAFHEWQKRVPKEVIGKFLKELGVWIKHSSIQGVEFIAVGLTGTHWNQIVWDQAIQNKLLHESKHRFCGLNLKLRDLDAPSNLCVKILSTTPHESTPCTCGIPFKDHVNDWHSYGQDTDRVTHRDAINMLYKKMIEKDILVFKSHVTHENVEPMFPTDERVEWKRKRKENKEKGIEVKKRIKVVEDHRDDCGDNLLGLGDDVSELLLYYSFEND